jgi:hypothetical protein
MDDEADDAVHHAERIVWAAGWRLQESMVLAELAGTSGLARRPLDPRSEVIQLVTFDGEHLGHVRREAKSVQAESWVAVPKDQARLPGASDSAAEAAWVLAQRAGKLPGS